MRRNIASLAARLMAEDGIDDYGIAKRKAARQLGAPDSEALPNNAEVEAELRAYQSLYQGEEQRERIAELRRIALKAMHLLKSFSPYLVGHVLEGTAGRYADVDLLLFTDAAKEVEIFLLNQGIAYEHAEPRRSHRADGEAAEMQLRIELDGVTVRLTIYDADGERSPRRNPHTGRTVERASLEAVEALVAGQP